MRGIAAIHLIDLCLWYMGSIPERVSCRGPKDSANHKYAEPEKQERMLGLSSIS